jgi:hypothetical protein
MACPGTPVRERAAGASLSSERDDREAQRPTELGKGRGHTRIAQGAGSRRRHKDGDLDNCRHQCGHEYPDQYPEGGVVLHVS